MSGEPYQTIARRKPVSTSAAPSFEIKGRLLIYISLQAARRGSSDSPTSKPSRPVDSDHAAFRRPAVSDVLVDIDRGSLEHATFRAHLDFRAKLFLRMTQGASLGPSPSARAAWGNIEHDQSGYHGNEM